MSMTNATTFSKGMRVRDTLTNETGVFDGKAAGQPDGFVWVIWDTSNLRTATPVSRLELLPAPAETEIQRLRAAIAELQKRVTNLEARAEYRLPPLEVVMHDYSDLAAPPQGWTPHPTALLATDATGAHVVVQDSNGSRLETRDGGVTWAAVQPDAPQTPADVKLSDIPAGPVRKRYVVEGSSDEQANVWPQIDFDDLQTAIDYADVLAETLQPDDDTVYTVRDTQQNNVIRHRATAPAAPLIVTLAQDAAGLIPAEHDGDPVGRMQSAPAAKGGVKLTAHRRKLLEALAEGATIDVGLSPLSYNEIYDITWFPTYQGNNVTPATVALFKEHGWIEEVDGKFSGSAYVITELGRQAVRNGR